MDKCIICWEQDWEDCFEIQDFHGKESFVFKVKKGSKKFYDMKLSYFCEISD